MIGAIVIVADTYTLYDSINFGLFRAAITAIGGSAVIVGISWIVVTDKGKGKIAIKTAMALLAVFTVYALLLSFVLDMIKFDIRTAQGRVTNVDIFPPPSYFLSQNFNFDGEGDPLNYHMGVSTFYVVRGRSYKIRYLPRSRSVLTIKEISSN